MKNLRVATAQFENRSGDKAHNLSVIRRLAGQAAAQGAQAVAFHECSVTGYTFARHLSREQMLDLAEPVPDGPSIAVLADIAREHDIAVLAGLFEKDTQDRLFKAYVCVDKNGLVAKYRKLHPFINPHLLPGNEYVVFDLCGWKCGILICYDNNIIENVRATALLGADLIFMPHVTMCTPSTRPGAGFVDPKLWKNREADPTSLRLEFDGMKGRAWLMKWLPTRAYDLWRQQDLPDRRTLGDEVITATCTPEKLQQSGGHRYRKARRPDLYGNIIAQPHQPEQKVVWLHPSSDDTTEE